MRVIGADDDGLVSGRNRAERVGRYGLSEKSLLVIVSFDPGVIIDVFII